MIAQGTGQALETGRRGDADVVLVHSRAAEDAFVAAGYGARRVDVMYNDFVIVGPDGDPAGVSGASDAAGAMALIANTASKFASRGDDSGTHNAERDLWQSAGIEPGGAWYLETGSGMGATLNIAAELPAYTIADRGTWISFQNRGSLAIQFDDDPQLFNPYGVILVSPARHPHVKAGAGQALIDWLTSKTGQAAIGSYMIDGQQLFFPNAGSGKQQGS